MLEPVGTRKERDLFYIVNQHYNTGLADLESRFSDWDRKLELFYSYIDETSWPYSSQVFVPQTFTTLFEKTARLNGGRPSGRLIPREGGDYMSARIMNEVLNYQWDDVVRVDKEPMVAKWARMDLNARIYGGSFALCKWRYETNKSGVKFDGPAMRVLANKDCIYNPAYSTVKNWFQYRDYVTISELENVNDVSSSKPRYKNLKLLRDILQKTRGGGDKREVNYVMKGRNILGLSDYMGTDEDPQFRIIEIVTEYRDDRVVVFCPKHGVVIRDEPNPYEHGQIPIVLLKYISVDDDIYGLSEIEPIEKIQKAINSLTSQYIDAINMDLYRVLQVSATGVQMHTLEYGPGKKWIMNRPGQDVIPLETSVAATSEFVDTYSVLTSMLKEAVGETSAAFSSLQPGSSNKTATEINSLEQTKSVRDNFNQIFLGEAIKQQFLMWCSMDKQFLFSDPSKQHFILRIVGRDTMADFERMGMGDMLPDTSEESMIGAERDILQTGEENIGKVPRFPVEINGEVKPKFEKDESESLASIYVTPEDVGGQYDYIVDVEPMRAGRSAEDKQIKLDQLDMLLNPTVLQLLAQEGKKIKVEDLLIDTLEATGSKGAERYFEEGGMNEQTANAQAGGTQEMLGGGIPAGTQEPAGMEVGGGMAQGQGVPFMGGPEGV